MDPKFCSWEGRPAVWWPGCAYAYLGDNSWHRVDDADVGNSAKVLSKAAFEGRYPSLPPWPAKVVAQD